jgi:hypothetical protein
LLESKNPKQAMTQSFIRMSRHYRENARNQRTPPREVLTILPTLSLYANTFVSLEYNLSNHVFFNREFLIRARAHRVCEFR